jgi:prepilin signal peptidase PulO-like enzyme (type II secretory pathway)
VGFLLFALGAAFGSFIKVIADRYDPDRFLFHQKVIGGRSHCPECRTKLRWFELVPVMSYLWQRGKCRNCGRNIDWQCLAVELACGLLFVFIPQAVYNPYLLPTTYYLLSAAWLFAFSTLLLVALIDFRLTIIPDEAHAMLFAAAIAIIFLAPFGAFEGSFMGSYGGLFGFRQNPWLSHFLGAVIAAALFGFLIAVTRGRGMGAGDFKLAAALGFLFGWPDILLVLALSFIIGSVAGVAVMIARSKRLKSHIAFGPFLGAGALTVFFFGPQIMQFYFGLFR